MRTADPIGLAKAILWEEAKGKLRAMVAAEGANMTHGRLEDGRMQFEIIEDIVEAFIKEIEQNEYNL